MLSLPQHLICKCWHASLDMSAQPAAVMAALCNCCAGCCILLRHVLHCALLGILKLAPDQRVVCAGTSDTALAALAALKLHLQRMHADSELASCAQKVIRGSLSAQQIVLFALHSLATVTAMSSACQCPGLPFIPAVHVAAIMLVRVLVSLRTVDWSQHTSIPMRRAQQQPSRCQPGPP